MPKICIILGSALVNNSFYLDMHLKVVLTKYGKVRFHIKDDICYLQRHGVNTPPHMINHRANISAIKELGIKKVIAINSVGSLKQKIAPGVIVVPDDYIDFQNKYTFFDNGLKFTIPGLSKSLRKNIIDAANKSKIQIIKKGVYVQTRGPRFETPAEIKFYSKIADIVGMTLASEATLAKEAEIEYAAICGVDNYGNGIGTKKITIKEIEKIRKQNIDKLKKLLFAAVKVIK